MTTTNPGPASVRFARRSTRGVLLGFSLPRAIVLAAAIALVVVGLVADGLAGFIVSGKGRGERRGRVTRSEAGQGGALPRGGGCGRALGAAGVVGGGAGRGDRVSVSAMSPLLRMLAYWVDLL